MESFTNDPLTISHSPSIHGYPYYIEGTYLYKKMTSGKPIVISNRIEIIQISRDIDTGEVLLVLSFDFGNQSQTHTTSRGILTRRNIFDLLRLGVDIPERKASEILEWLNQQEKNIPIDNVHSGIGFGIYEGKTIYKLHNAIGINSAYQGDLNLKPRGTLESWRAIINDNVIGQTPLELALVFGLAAPVFSLIADVTGLEVMLVHLFGDSSQGKTTAARLAVSPFGYPHFTEGGLIKTWNSTQNALLSQLRDNNGVPIAIDEASMHDGSFLKFIYILAGGKDKDRLNKNSLLQKTGRWKGLIISTAEHSLVSKSSKNTGVQMRVLECANVPWTVSAQNAENLNKGLLANYGHSGPVFVNYLMDIGTEGILKDWDEWKTYIFSFIINPNQFTSRLVDKLAIFMITANYAIASLNLDINLDKLLQLLLKFINDKNIEIDISASAHEYFIQAVVINRSNFLEASINLPSGNTTWGKIIMKNDKIHEVLILAKEFDRIMKEGNFEDSRVILSKWRENGLIECDKDGRFSRKRIISGFSVRVYVIRVEKP